MYLKAKTPKRYRWYTRRLRPKELTHILFALAAVLAVAAGITFFAIYNEGNIAATNADDLLDVYEQNVASNVQNEAVSIAPTQATSLPAFGPIQRYQLIGKLEIEKIGQALPVISETTTDALKVSCCYYRGSMPGEKGNMIITGHDYANGAIFGKLSELGNGDLVVLSTPAKDYTYAVYNTKVIKPDDVAALNENTGDMTLTLMTCTGHGNRRLLVFCKLVSDEIS